MSYPQGPQYGGYQQQQPGGYPQQQGGYPPQQPGYPPPYPPKKNNGMIIALAGVAAAAVIALVLVLVLSGKDDSGSSSAGGDKPAGAPDVTVPGPNKPSGGRSTGGSDSGGGGTPEALAQAAVDAIESKSTSQIDSLACNSTAASELKRDLSRVPSGVTATVDDVKETGSTAQARITMKMGGQSEGFTMEMRKSGSKWCISGI
nr:hypothetical protein [Kibdelosporangium sp. MJ126-NF4]CEL23606.1 HMW subunit of glutenin 1Dx2.2* precursor [Kibdelosporangium sp. MJ126-NF4]CTQ93143.1 HMW subunit of glutenin 1Dx2.2* precursor [Kibdelosporangium sp. MJ126-NF4]